VEVLREALAQDELRRLKSSGQRVKTEECRRKVKLLIQNIHHFRDANLIDKAAPFERIAVFDEAQRAWDAKHLSGFMTRKKGQPDFNQSEPGFLVEVFNRHDDWCVIVCLVGGGQEINAGEAGLPEWFSAIAAKHRGWKVHVSDQLGREEYRWGRDLPHLLRGLDYTVEPDLHLDVAIRSFRAEKLSAFVNALISGEAASARELQNEISAKYPIFVTRDLAKAKSWLREQARGSERFGLVAYSGASRLKPEGINVHEKIDAPTWFLNGKSDVCARPITWKTLRRNSIFKDWNLIGSGCAGTPTFVGSTISGHISTFAARNGRPCVTRSARLIWRTLIAFCSRVRVRA